MDGGGGGAAGAPVTPPPRAAAAAAARPVRIAAPPSAQVPPPAAMGAAAPDGAAAAAAPLQRHTGVAAGAGGVPIAYEVVVGRPPPAAAGAATAAAGPALPPLAAAAAGGATNPPRPTLDAPAGRAAAEARLRPPPPRVRVPPTPLGVVVFLAGMACPRSMWSSVATSVARAGWSALLLDNRGAGASGAVAASPFSAPAYHIAHLAADTWAAVDAAVVAVPAAFPAANPHPVLVGHSMGGMIAARAAVARPSRVGGLGLISTHAGGVVNRVPTVGVLRAAARLIAGGFDPAVEAGVNLDLHFTPGYLAQRVGGAVGRRVGRGVAAAEAAVGRAGRAVGRAVGAAEAAVGVGGDPQTVGVAGGSAGGVVVASATRTTAMATAGGGWATPPPAVATVTATVTAGLTELRSPARPVAVVYGAADVVVAPSATRALAAAVAADVVVEVSGAHFVVDENEAEVTAVTLDLLRRAAAIHGVGGRRRGLLDMW
ncbi:hypothetical protein BU14_0219s0007 [Porphyra umbilicalis]|uniref:AB hydrolase-1 domain-containing protein n=1 Tax=Porphyra umbilicalis TaxID=2786 RepID=A0A1X6P4M9_PORUM|nr:hypothetical protein BU14_0219s0007 [Porphyra umbilicalis]|eukprot:OSX75807.1 hypothetical protein BU14_0219s0007 [Porphyra umbilicalis]